MSVNSEFLVSELFLNAFDLPTNVLYTRQSLLKQLTDKAISVSTLVKFPSGIKMVELFSFEPAESAFLNQEIFRFFPIITEKTLFTQELLLAVIEMNLIKKLSDIFVCPEKSTIRPVTSITIDM